MTLCIHFQTCIFSCQ